MAVRSGTTVFDQTKVTLGIVGGIGIGIAFGVGIGVAPGVAWSNEDEES